MGRTNAVARFAEHESLHDPIFERVERDDRETTLWSKERERGVQTLLEIRELVVHRDAQRLEHASRGIDGARALLFHAEHEATEVIRGEERLTRATAHDGRRDATGLRLLAVLGEDAAQLDLIPGVHDVGRRPAKVWVGAHVQRAFRAKAEASLRVGELERREPEIEECAIETLEAALAGHDVANREVGPNEYGPVSEPGKDTPRFIERCGVDVQTDETAGRSGPLEDGLGVASRSDRAVEEAASFAGTKFGENFGQENRLMKPPIARPRDP